MLAGGKSGLILGSDAFPGRLGHRRGRWRDGARDLPRHRLRQDARQRHRHGDQPFQSLAAAHPWRGAAGVHAALCKSPNVGHFVPRWRRNAARWSGPVLCTRIREVTMLFRQMATALAGALVLAGVMAADASAQQRDLDDDLAQRSPRRMGAARPEASGLRHRPRCHPGSARREDWYRDSQVPARCTSIAERNDVHMMSIRLVYSQRLRRGLPRRSADPAGRGSAARPAGRAELHSPHRDGLPLASGLRRRGRHQGVRRAVAPRPARTAPRPPTGPMPGAAPGSSSAASRCPCSARTATRCASAGARAASRPSALHARGADVELLRVTVTTQRRSPTTSATCHFLRQGSFTPPLDLKGWQRPIDRVDMVYKTVPNFKGLATVCVEGLQ